MRRRIPRFVLTVAALGEATSQFLPQRPGVAAVTALVVAVVLEVVPPRG